MSVRKSEVKGITKELEERVDALSFNSVGAWWSSMQLLVHVELPELHSIFLNCLEQQMILPWHWLHELLPWKQRCSLDIHLPYVQCLHKTCTGYWQIGEHIPQR